MEDTLQTIAKFSPDNIVQIIIAGIAVLAAIYVLFVGRKSTFRLTDARGEQDTITGLLVGAILGALTGVLWAIKLVRQAGAREIFVSVVLTEGHDWQKKLDRIGFDWRTNLKQLGHIPVFQKHPDGWAPIPATE